MPTKKVGKRGVALQQEWTQRQRQLREIGDAGQETLMHSRVAVVGAGGLGCSSLYSLVGAGIGNLSVFDPDKIEISNLHRQQLYSYEDVGKKKAQTAAKRLAEYNPSVNIQPYDVKITESNVAELLRGHDIALDGTDDWVSKFLLHEACRVLNIPLVQSSVYQWEGEIQVFRHRELDPCLSCLWPDEPGAECLGNCREAGVLGPVPQVMGTLQAGEAIKILLGMETLKKEKLLFDFQTLRSLVLKTSKREGCEVCSRKGFSLSRVYQRQQERIGREEWEILAHELSPKDLENYHWIDIREENEISSEHSLEKKMVHFPLSKWELPPIEKFAGDCLIICQKGMRSKKVVRQMREKNWKNLYSLAGGLSALPESLNETD